MISAATAGAGAGATAVWDNAGRRAAAAAPVPSSRAKARRDMGNDGRVRLSMFSSSLRSNHHAGTVEQPRSQGLIALDLGAPQRLLPGGGVAHGGSLCLPDLARLEADPAGGEEEVAVAVQQL